MAARAANMRLIGITRLVVRLRCKSLRRPLRIESQMLIEWPRDSNNKNTEAMARTKKTT